MVGWIRLIMSDTNSRNLLGFLILNLSFAFVELFYGVRSKRNHSASFVMKTLIARCGPTPWVSSLTVSTCSSIAQVRSLAVGERKESCLLSITGLLAGLVATVITKWRANDKYSYGRSETH